MKQVEVSILGQVYILACPDGGEALLAAAVSAVDKEMTAIRDAGKVKARERIAVLAALNVAYQLAESAQAQAAKDLSADALTTASALPTDGVDGVDEVLVASLIRRVETALADDGQLL